MADRYSTQNLNRTLTQFAVENMGLGGPFVADQLAPVVHVPTTAGKYYKFSNIAALRNDYDALRAPLTESNEIRRSYDSATYACKQYGLRELIADEEMDNADRAVIDPERDAMALIIRKLRLPIELRIVSMVMSTSVITNNAAATAAWNAASGVDIEGDIDGAKLSVRKKAGVEPNTIVIPPHIAVEAKKDEKILFFNGKGDIINCNHISKELGQIFYFNNRLNIFHGLFKNFKTVLAGTLFNIINRIIKE